LFNTGASTPSVLFIARTYGLAAPALPANTTIGLAGQVSNPGLDTPNRPAIGLYGSAEPAATTTPGSVGCGSVGTGTMGSVGDGKSRTRSCAAAQRPVRGVASRCPWPGSVGWAAAK
jgi:hypothetical protein